MAFSGPLVWLDHKTLKVKLAGLVSYGPQRKSSSPWKCQIIFLATNIELELKLWSSNYATSYHGDENLDVPISFSLVWNFIGWIEWPFYFNSDCGVPAREVGGGVYAKIEAVREWIWKTTHGCNEKTCRQGNCIRIDDLHPQLQEMLGLFWVQVWVYLKMAKKGVIKAKS